MEEYGQKALASIPGHYLINFRKAILEQAEDGIRDVLGSRGLGDVYKRQCLTSTVSKEIRYS